MGSVDMVWDGQTACNQVVFPWLDVDEDFITVFRKTSACEANCQSNQPRAIAGQSIDASMVMHEASFY
jgi:hypothetical protein